MQQFTFEKEKIYSVGEYICWINEKLQSKVATVLGEVTKVSEREKAIYFSVKDPRPLAGGGAILNCLIWRFRYAMMGVRLEEGMQIKIQGAANVYPPTGSFNFKADVIELAGEGTLKKAYEELRRKLEAAGLFDFTKKKEIKKFSKNIGLITSKYGDAIHDFNTNISKAGFDIKFLDCRVEGNQAVPDIIEAIKHFNNMPDLDVIVITRGGGSWESLQAFNNEAVCNAVFQSKIPVLCGIGHEKDVPLACLAADKSVSTPTAAAEFLSKPFKQAKSEISRFHEKILSQFKEEINKINYFLDSAKYNLSSRFKNILTDIRHKIALFEQRISDNSPMRQLERGYSLVFKKGKIVVDSSQLSIRDDIEIKFKKGKIRSKVFEINV